MWNVKYLDYFFQPKSFQVDYEKQHKYNYFIF